jgi:hypothetical protein
MLTIGMSSPHGARQCWRLCEKSTRYRLSLAPRSLPDTADGLQVWPVYGIIYLDDLRPRGERTEE